MTHLISAIPLQLNSFSLYYHVRDSSFCQGVKEHNGPLSYDSNPLGILIAQCSLRNSLTLSVHAFFAAVGGQLGRWYRHNIPVITSSDRPCHPVSFQAYQVFPTLLTTKRWDLASKVFLKIFAPHDRSFIEMHFWDISMLQALNGLRKVLSQSFGLKLGNGISQCLERKYNSSRVWESVESLPLTTKEGLVIS